MSDEPSINSEEIKKQITSANTELKKLRKQKELMQKIYDNLSTPECEFHLDVVKALSETLDDISWKGNTRRISESYLDFLQSFYSGKETNTLNPIRQAIKSEIKAISKKISQLEQKLGSLSYKLHHPYLF